MNYVKKPIVIEAFQWLGETVPLNTWPEWAVDAYSSLKIRPQNISSAFMVIETLEGSIKASCGDYIIRGFKGEIYPCKPDIFAMTYDRVEQDK